MDRERYDREKKLIESKLSFCSHVVIYLLVSGLFIMPELSLEGLKSSIIPIGFWGFALVSHFLKAFIFNENYIDRKVKSKIDC